jgi:hypothetical protein
MLVYWPGPVVGAAGCGARIPPNAPVAPAGAAGDDGVKDAGALACGGGAAAGDWNIRVNSPGFASGAGSGGAGCATSGEEGRGTNVSSRAGVWNMRVNPPGSVAGTD